MNKIIFHHVPSHLVISNNLTLSKSIGEAMAAPAVGTYPVMTLRTPSGMPAYLDYQKYIFLKKTEDK